MTCTCPHLLLNGVQLPQTIWGETCPEHGVGTAWFRALPQRPFGFRDEEFANMSRDTYLTLMDQWEEEPVWFRAQEDEED